MPMAPSSHRPGRALARARMRLVVASCAIATTWTVALIFASRAAAAGDPIRLARFTEENLPAQDMPSVVATPATTPSPAADWVTVPYASSSTASAPAAPATASTPPAPPAASGSPLPAEATAAQLEPTPIPSPTDIAPLEVGSVAPQIQISDSSLDSLIQSVSSAQPASAASLRLTDQARNEILSHHEGDAIQTITRAISIDASNPYAYFYLGRAYLAKKNYDQAITFLNRAEARFGANAEWLGETLAFEGLANEQSGQTAAAIACYQKALVAVPGNLMARVGLTRLGGDQAASPVAPIATPTASGDNNNTPPPEGDAIPPPPDSQPPPPFDSQPPPSAE